jgi:hypothetical protein
VDYRRDKKLYWFAAIKSNQTVFMTAQKIILNQLKYLREEFLDDLLDVLEQRRTTPKRRWLKTHEVQRILGISTNTLHKLRIKKLLPYSRVEGIVYYDFYDVMYLLEQSRQGEPPPRPRKDPRMKWKGEPL